MATSVRELRARTKSVTSMKKITRAMELIAASRIIKAQQRAQAAAPYARELTRAYEDFLNRFETSEGERIKAGHEEFDALEDEDIEQEQIVKQKRG